MAGAAAPEKLPFLQTAPAATLPALAQRLGITVMSVVSLGICTSGSKAHDGSMLFAPQAWHLWQWMAKSAARSLG